MRLNNYLFSFVSMLVFLSLTAVQAGKKNKSVDIKKTKYLWSICDNCKNPESAYFDPTTKHIFISNVNGNPTEKDGNGSIQRLHAGGKVISNNLVAGLNAPKGMRAHNGVLWVSDIDEIVAIDITTGKIIKKHFVAGAKFLNDVAITETGKVFVSDMLDNVIYQVENDQVTKFKEGVDLDAPNGLLVEGDSLVVGSWGIPAADFSTKTPGRLYKIHLTTKAITYISPKPFANLDGLEADGQGGYLVSDWMAGKIYRISEKGKAEELFFGMNGAADIGYIHESKTLIVPRMNESVITAIVLGHQ